MTTRRFVSEAIYALEQAGFRVVRGSNHDRPSTLYAYKTGAPCASLVIKSETVNHSELERVTCSTPD